MSPLLKAIGVGLAVLAGSFLLLWLIARALHRPLIEPFRRSTPTPTATLLPPAAPVSQPTAPFLQIQIPLH